MFIAFSTTLGIIAFLATLICLSFVLFPIFFIIVAMPSQQTHFMRFIETSLVTIVITGFLSLILWLLSWLICPICLYLSYRLGRLGFYKRVLSGSSIPA